MAKNKRTSPLSDAASERSLESLIRRYLDKTDELESKEEKVMKKMELMEMAVASLQGWNQKRTSAKAQSDRVVNLDEIEEETRQIKEETKRIQKEVREKIEENKRLQDKLDQRRKKERKPADGTVKANFMRAIEREKQRREDAEINACPLNPSAPVLDGGEDDDEDDSFADADPVLRNDPRIKMFKEKVRQLKGMEKKLKRESEEDAKAVQSQRDKLLEKIEMLEWKAEVDRQLIQSLKRKYVEK